MRSVSLLPNSSVKLAAHKQLNLSDGPSLVYSFGLAAVGVALIALPIAYLGTVGASIWLLYLHLTRHAAWIVSPQVSLPMACLYVAGALLLGLFGFFLVRPLIPKGGGPKADHPISPEDEPRLHAFVQQICAALGSPSPIRILVNMEVNASARFANGFVDFWDGRLELVLGLPLVRGLDLGQFAGVLAHELGHFRQGFAMRLVHGMRALNQWFAHAATDEDDWEKELSQKGHRVNPWLFVPLWSARGSALLVRWILKAHMYAGQVVSCVLLRQMEYQADHAAIRMVGGETFSGMVLEAKVLEAAWGLANRSLGMALREGRLANDLPALVAAHTRVFIPEVRRKMERTLLKEKAAWFDTHPSLADRIGRARQAMARGMFHSPGQAHSLFIDFPAVSRQATIAFYLQDLGDDYNPSRMISTSELVTGQSEIQIGEAAVNGYFLGLLSNLRPIWVTPSDLNRPTDSAHLRESLRNARATLEKQFEHAAELYRAYSLADSKLINAIQARSLIRANFWIEPKDFQLGGGGLIRADAALQAAELDQSMIAEKLSAFEAAMHVRLVSALGLLADPEVGNKLRDASANSREVLWLLPGLEGISKVQNHLYSLRTTMHGMSVLIENLEGNEKSLELLAQIKVHSQDIRSELEAIINGLGQLDYPLQSHTSETGMAGYALDKLPPLDDFAAHFAAAEETLNRCYAFYFRVLGRLALAAGRVEGVLGLGPLQIGGLG